MKSKYQNWLTDEGVEKIRGWVQSGLGRAEVAEKIGISPDTFTRWCRRFPKLAGLSGGAVHAAAPWTEGTGFIGQHSIASKSF